MVAVSQDGHDLHLWKSPSQDFWKTVSKSPRLLEALGHKKSHTTQTLYIQRLSIHLLPTTGRGDKELKIKGILVKKMGGFIWRN